MTGKLNPKPKTEEKTRTIRAEPKLGAVKFEKKDCFSSLNLG